MASYLLAWNPKRWKWHDLDDIVEACSRGEVVTYRWSCGNNRQIVAGDRVFLIRLGTEPRGIFGYGTTITASYEDTHWEDVERTGQYVQFQIDSIVHPDHGPIIPRERLDKTPFSAVHWSTQKSGIAIPDAIAVALHEEWTRIIAGDGFCMPEEIPAVHSYFEGAQRLVTVNSYERNTAARNACIAHYGARCVICGFAFVDKYGPNGEGVIHVHHLVPLSQLGEAYKLDPIKDLRPVCPNCHAIIHSRVPPYPIRDVNNMIGV